MCAQYNIHTAICLTIYFFSITGKNILPKLVAGAGIEPASGGYEPPEVPLLYPAITEYTIYNIIFKSTTVDKNQRAS